MVFRRPSSRPFAFVAPLAALSFVSLASLAACSSSSTPAKPGGVASAAQPAPTDDPPADAGAPDDTTPPPDACGEVPKSQCNPANPGSVVRGIVTFDPAAFAGTPAPKLRIFLHHQFIVKEDEAKEGGHPHAYTSVDKVDVASGQVAFSIDLCEFGTAMYSEENCGFNLVALFDTDGSHDPDKVGLPAFIPKKGELAKMTPITVSCHAPSQCLQIKADCTDGEDCVTFTGLTSCTCATPSCPSDSVICTK